jgi:hypothetical protein
MKVVVDARLEPGAAGGVVQAVLGLVHGLSRLDRDGDDYRLLVRPGRGDWLRPYAGDLPFLEAVRSDTQLPLPSLRARVARRLHPREADELVPPSKGVAEAFGADVIHLPTQQGFTTEIPTLYHPWDLQHVHYPEFFEEGERRDRDRIYRALCRQARVVVTPTRWAADDVVSNLGVPRRKVAVVAGASPLSVYGEPTEADLARVRADRHLPEEFVLYPAQTWPHKNHLALVDGLAERLLPDDRGAGAGVRRRGAAVVHRPPPRARADGALPARAGARVPVALRGLGLSCAGGVLGRRSRGLLRRAVAARGRRRRRDHV